MLDHTVIRHFLQFLQGASLYVQWPLVVASTAEQTKLILLRFGNAACSFRQAVDGHC